VAFPLYIPPAARTNENGNEITNKDLDIVSLVPKVESNLMQYTDPSVPVVDFTVMSIPNPLKPSNLSDRETSIKEFLCRPVLCPSTATDWTTAQGRGTVLMSMDIPSALLNLDLYKEKVAGFYGFKGDLVLEFQTNAQKFQQGMVLIAVFPYAPMLSSYRVSTTMFHPTLFSQLPSVRHDISQTNSTVIKVPFSSPMLTYPLDTSRSKDHARVYYIVYSPLTIDTLKYRCWCHFENVELEYPMAQSGSMRVRKKANRFTPSDAEDTGGIISTPIATISSGVRQLGDNIPLISSFSQPAAWFLDSLSKGFASFGLSNPVDTSVRHSVVARTFSHPNNIDVNDTVDSFGYLAGNKVSHLSGFAGTDVDEMSLQHINSIPAFLKATFWTTADAVGAQIMSITIGKVGWSSACNVNTSAGTRIAKAYPPFAYVANRFAYFRGSTKYKFYAVKTNFHNGRLLFVFSPNYLDTNNTFAKAHYNTRYIWDISQTPTFEITVPFIHPQSWASYDTNSNAGSLKMFIFNALDAAPGASTQIEILCEVSAGPDFEVAHANDNIDQQVVLMQSPGVDIDSPFINYSKYKEIKQSQQVSNPLNQGDKIYGSKKKQPLIKTIHYKNANKKKSLRISNVRDLKYSIVAQSPDSAMGGPSDQKDDSINQAQIDSAGFNALFTTGESLKSLRQILKRSNMKYLGLSTNTGTYVYTVDTHTCFYNRLPTGAAENLTISRDICDDYDYFMGCFGMYRGSMIYRINPHTSAQLRLRTILEPVLTQANPPTISTTAVVWSPRQVNQVSSNSFIQGGLDVHVPFYSPTHSSIMWHGIPATQVTGNVFDYGHKTIAFCALSPTGNVCSFDVYRQVGDDFSCGGFISTMPVLDSPLPAGALTIT
jgi:hypothetical protein